MTTRIALVGYGHIARHEHVPAIRANPDFDLVAVVTPSEPAELECAYFPNVAQMFAALPGGIDAVAICTPPGPRFEIARDVIAAGVPLLLEKPPTATIGELDDLVQLAHAHDVPMFTAWHSQHAAAIEPARQILASDEILSLSMLWQEDVRKFHADQNWIWEAGGFGVFDPGINGLSILTYVLPDPLLVRAATLYFPANKQAPIAAQIEFQGSAHSAIMDWRSDRNEQWSITIETASGKKIGISQGGAALSVDGVAQTLPPHDEYRGMYQKFAELLQSGRNSIDREPMRIVADCFLIATRKMVEDFA